LIAVNVAKPRKKSTTHTVYAKLVIVEYIEKQLKKEKLKKLPVAETTENHMRKKPRDFVSLFTKEKVVMQYDLFESPEICHVKQTIETLDAKCSRTDRRLFASVGELKKRTEVLEGVVEDLLQVIMSLQNINTVKPKTDKVIKPVFGELMEMSK
jgi:hypothetical protein